MCCCFFVTCFEYHRFWLLVFFTMRSIQTSTQRHFSPSPVRTDAEVIMKLMLHPEDRILGFMATGHRQSLGK